MPEVGDTRSVKLAEGVEMKFCWIPPGSFRMGSRDGDSDEQPVHEVEITRGFWLGRTPVTQREYQAFDPEHKNGFCGNPEHPAEKIDWNRAVAFFEWLTKRLDPGEWDGWAANLPSEAQWEYACRAGAESEYHAGDGDAALRAAGWYNHNSSGSTHRVRHLEANAFGLHDMHGNVDEWCRDRWGKNSYRTSLTKKADAESDPARVLRGGSWNDHPGYCRSAFRFRLHPGGAYHSLGFRVGLFPGPSCQDESRASEGGEQAAGRRAVSARAAGGEGRTRDHDMEGTINEIALSSLDGALWHDAQGESIERDRIQGCVTRVVIGELKAETPITMSDAIRQQLREHWPTITHLHLWSLDALTALPDLPPKLKCLDLRHCNKIESLPELPETLETLDLEGCTALKKLPAGRTPEMRYLHLDRCTLPAAGEINKMIGACSKLKELTLSGCTQLENLSGLAKLAANEDAPLRKLVLKGCSSLASLPSLDGLRKLQHLNLNGCSALSILPSIPDALQYLILSGCDQLVEFDGQGIDVRDRGEREDGDENKDDGENVARWFHVRRKYGGELAFSARAKLLLLGDGRAGKTTLAKRLIWNSLSEEAQRAPENSKMRPVEGEWFTHKIQFFQWRCPVEVPEKIAKRIDRLSAEGVDLHGAEEISGKRATARIGIWDFGGQEIYHRTHRMFTSAGNVFLIVWREELADEEILALLHFWWVRKRAKYLIFGGQHPLRG